MTWFKFNNLKYEKLVFTVKEFVILKKKTQLNKRNKSLNLLKKKALKPDLKTLVFCLKKVIKKNEDRPNNSQEISKKNQLLEKTKKTMLNTNKFSCTKNFSLFIKSTV